MNGADDPDARLRMADALERRRQHEAREAGALVARFAREAAEAGIPAERLTARAYSGTTRFKTQVQGWYLKRDRSVAVGTDGLFYVLSAHGGIAERFTGVTLKPADAPLELGRGARDGESMPIAEALAARLAGGAAWPS